LALLLSGSPRLQPWGVIVWGMYSYMYSLYMFRTDMSRRVCFRTLFGCLVCIVCKNGVCSMVSVRSASYVSLVFVASASVWLCVPSVFRRYGTGSLGMVQARLLQDMVGSILCRMPGLMWFCVFGMFLFRQAVLAESNVAVMHLVTLWAASQMTSRTSWPVV